jgi:hypothetical protein
VRSDTARPRDQFLPSNLRHQVVGEKQIHTFIWVEPEDQSGSSARWFVCEGDEDKLRPGLEAVLFCTGIATGQSTDSLQNGADRGDRRVTLHPRTASYLLSV